MKKTNLKFFTIIAVMLFSVMTFAQNGSLLKNEANQLVVLQADGDGVNAVPDGFRSKKANSIQSYSFVSNTIKSKLNYVKGIKGSVPLKPLYEEFTSATCGPCADANIILDAILDANPGDFSLIKYQMSWPGSGDPYYTEEGGVRKTFYGVSAVPAMYINANQQYPGAMTQAIFDSYLSETTDMSLEIVSSIDENYVISVDATVHPHADYAAGLTLHIAVVEKITVGNVMGNGELEFNNVFLKMLPDAEGTTLDALSSNVPVVISESFDMSLTFMEEPDDLAVIVFTQDDATKTVYQSEMIDVGGTFDSYEVTFVVDDSDGNLVEGAAIFLEGNGSTITDANGEAVYEGVFPGSFTYDIEKPGLVSVYSSFDLIDQNITEYATMGIPNFYFYEDFELGLPGTWTSYSSGVNFVYWQNGTVLFFRQMAGDENLMLISPEIDFDNAGTLIMSIGAGNGNPIVSVGTVDAPTNPNSFTELTNFTATPEWQDFDLDLSSYAGDHSYIAIKLASEFNCFFSLDLFKITWGEVPLYPPANLTAEVLETDVNLNWDAPDLEDLLGYNVYRNDELIANVTETTYTDLGLETGIYDYYVKAAYDQGESPPSNIVNIMVGDVVIYCDAEGGCDEFIDGVVFGDINNMGSGCINYGDYTDMSTVVEPGMTYQLEWTTGSFYEADDYGIWIDWNQNGDFTDAGENMICEFAFGAELNTFDIIVPADAVPGDTRMRLRVKWGGDDCGEPCGQTPYGEVEDYTITVAGTPPGDCQNFDALAVGDYVAEQLGGMWTTWSGAVGTAEDAMVSDMYSNSPENGFVVDAGAIDLILKLANEPISTGQWLYSNMIYVPAGTSGYFNVQSEPTPGVEWVVEVFFNSDGTGNVTENTNVNEFTYIQDTWILVEINIDLDNGGAEVLFDGVEFYQWENPIATIGSIDYFGWDTGGPPGAYYDDVCFSDEGWLVTRIEEELASTTNLYPNPATDMVNIESEYNMESVTVYNFAGQAILTESVNNTTYRINTANFDSGIYLFQIETQEGRIAKRLVIE